MQNNCNLTLPLARKCISKMQKNCNLKLHLGRKKSKKMQKNCENNANKIIVL